MTSSPVADSDGETRRPRVWARPCHIVTRQSAQCRSISTGPGAMARIVNTGAAAGWDGGKIGDTVGEGTGKTLYGGIHE